MLLEILEWSVAIVFAIFFLTQVLIPMWKGTPYCPIFRKKRREVENELIGVKEKKEVAVLEATVAQEKQQLAQQKTVKKTSTKKQTSPGWI